MFRRARKEASVREGDSAGSDEATTVIDDLGEEAMLDPTGERNTELDGPRMGMARRGVLCAGGRGGGGGDHSNEIP